MGAVIPLNRINNAWWETYALGESVTSRLPTAVPHVHHLDSSFQFIKIDMFFIIQTFTLQIWIWISEYLFQKIF